MDKEVNMKQLIDKYGNIRIKTNKKGNGMKKKHRLNRVKRLKNGINK